MGVRQVAIGQLGPVAPGGCPSKWSRVQVIASRAVETGAVIDLGTRDREFPLLGDGLAGADAPTDPTSLHAVGDAFGGEGTMLERASFVPEHAIPAARLIVGATCARPDRQEQ